MTTLSKEKILAALSQIQDPDLHQDIVSCGFVKDISWDEHGRVAVKLELTTPACPVREQFQQQAEEVIRALDGVTSVDVTFSSRAVRPAVNEQPQGEASNLEHVQAIIAFSSCKGGVGKSTLAAHCALELNRRGFQIGLADLDVYGPSVPTLFQCENETLKTDKTGRLQPVEYQGLKLMSFGFALGQAPAVLRGPIVSQYIQQLLFSTAWGKLDYLILDLPPGTGDIQLTVAQRLKLHGAVIVTTPQTLSLVDVARGILMFEKVSVPLLGIAVNMALWECRRCHERHEIFGKVPALTLEEKFGIPVLAELPCAPEFLRPLPEVSAPPEIPTLTEKVIRNLGKSMAAASVAPQVRLSPEGLRVQWTGEGEEKIFPYKDLRAQCPCAQCVDEMTGRRRISKEQVPDDIHAESFHPLGHYAIAINWSDGHKNGIYSFSYLKKLAENPTPAPSS